MKHILKCVQCGKYTLRKTCSCGGKALPPTPPKFSLEDKYGSYRRQVKRQELEENGLL